MRDVGPTRNIRVSDADLGKELLDFLVARFTYQSESQWMEHLAAGRVTLNGKPCSGHETLARGDAVGFTPPHYEEPPVCADWKAIHEDDDFLFVDKPPMLPCHPGGIYLEHTLARMIARARPELSLGLDGVRLVNRLDRETSGIVIVAKTQEAAAFASARLQDGSLIKEYTVLVEGTFPEYLDAAGWLGRDEDSPIRKKSRFSREEIQGGQSARTEFWLTNTGAIITPRACLAPDNGANLPARGDGAGGALSLVRARLHTGRTHQIRATLHSLGYPVVGDKMYGRDPTIFLRFAAGEMTEADESLLRMPHQALHCGHISFPKTKKAPAGDYDILAERPKSWIV